MQLTDVGIISHLIACVGFVALAISVVMRPQRDGASSWLIIAALITAAWGGRLSADGTARRRLCRAAVADGDIAHRGVDRLSRRTAADVVGARRTAEFVVRHRQHDRLRHRDKARTRPRRCVRQRCNLAPRRADRRCLVRRRAADGGDPGPRPDPQPLRQRRTRQRHRHPPALHRARRIFRLRPQPVHAALPARQHVIGPVQHPRRDRRDHRAIASAVGAAGVGCARPGVAAGGIPHAVNVDHRRVSDRDGADRVWPAPRRRRLGATAPDHLPVRDDHPWRDRSRPAALPVDAAAADFKTFLRLSLRLSHRMAALHQDRVGDRRRVDRDAPGPHPLACRAPWRLQGLYPCRTDRAQRLATGTGRAMSANSRTSSSAR